MRTDRIREQIRAGKAEEVRTGTLRTALIGMARLNGKEVTAEQLDGMIGSIGQHVERVPALLDAIERAAEVAGVRDRVGPILAQAEEYWFQGMDLIPDHLGLLGLMDDAYYTMKLVQGICDNYLQQTGRPLLQVDLIWPSLFLRVLIGEPFVSLLDAAAQNAFQVPSLQSLLQALQSVPTLPVTDPIWGNASCEEIANVQLGAMGIF